MSFATSTAVFDATYRAQARVDAELTNGADVTVTGSAERPAGTFLARLAALPGAAAAAADAASLRLCRRRPPGSLRHRAALDRQGDAHVQRLFPERQCRRDAGIPGGDPGRSPGLRGNGPGLSASARRQDQSSPAERQRITSITRCPSTSSASCGNSRPRRGDSFLVANAAYVAQQTGSDAAEIVLLRSRGDPAGLASEVQELWDRHRVCGSRTSAARSAWSIPA